MADGADTDVREAGVAYLAQPSNAGVIAASNRVLAERAMQMRIAGASIPQIAASLGVTASRVEHAIERSLLRRAEKQNVTAMRELEEQRLDDLLLSWAQRAKSDPRAADIVLRISERRSRLEGLDMPMRVDIATVIAQIAANEGWDLDATIADVRMLARDAQQVSLEADDGQSPEADGEKVSRETSPTGTEGQEDGPPLPGGLD